MSIFFKEQYGTISKIEDKGGFTVCCFTTSEKNQDEEWENSFWNCILTSKSLEKITGKCRVKANGKLKKKGNYTNGVIFDVEVLEQREEVKQEGFFPVETDDELPF